MRCEGRRGACYPCGAGGIDDLPTVTRHGHADRHPGAGCNAR
jgi:hypothetical protein